MSAFSCLWILFVAMPLGELVILFKLHELVGWGRTISLVIITGFMGAALVKKQGFRLLSEMQHELAAGQLPAAKILDGVMILAAGAFLITPGVVTDLTGFLLLVPSFRMWVRGWLQRVIERKLRDGSVTIHRL
jgi:UPF0716 protein FxsA